MTRRLFAFSVLLLLTSGAGPQTAGVPRRIVSLVPNVTEMLFAIGAGDRLVGVSSFDAYPPEVKKITPVGGLLDPDLERIFALKPDLAVVYGSQQDLQRQLQRAGIETYPFRHGGLADITRVMRDLGARLGLRQQADKVSQKIERDLDAIRKRAAGRPRPRVLLVIGKERGALRAIYASGGVGFLHDLLEICGGTDVFADVKRESVQASTELILGRAPDVIIELHGDVMTPDPAAAEAQVWSSLTSIPAVQHSRVHVLSGQEFVVPGPRIVEAGERLARAIHDPHHEDH